MDQLPLRSGSKIQSFIEVRATSALQGDPPASVNFTVPTGTIFRGVLSGMGETSPTSSFIAAQGHLTKGGATIFRSANCMPFSSTVKNFKHGISTQIELQPGTYTWAVAMNMDGATGLAYAAVVGTCYYQNSL